MSTAREVPRTARARADDRLHATWIALAAGTMIALSLGVHLAVLRAAGGVGPATARAWAGPYLLGLCLAFLTGGGIVGWFSPGNTFKEAAASGGAAVTLLAAVSLVAGRGRGIEAILLAAFAGLVLALIGGWLGEWLKGKTR